jgi:hypothetical protein
MKKLLLSLALAFILLSCGDSISGNYSVSITNNSKKIVSYTYNGISDTLAVSQTKNYEVKAYTPSPQNIVDQNGVASVELTYQYTGNYTIEDSRTSYKLNVVNELPIQVSIRADNYIDDGGSPVLTIVANAEKTTAKIYTKSPKFTSLVNYPVIIDWNFSGDTVYVALR